MAKKLTDRKVAQISSQINAILTENDISDGVRDDMFQECWLAVLENPAMKINGIRRKVAKLTEKAKQNSVRYGTLSL